MSGGWYVRYVVASTLFCYFAAQQHVNMVRRHTYENVHKKPPLHSQSSPSLQLQQPPSGKDVQRSNMRASLTNIQLLPSSRKGYENVVLPELQSSTSPVPLYEEIESVGQPDYLTSQHPLSGSSRGRMASVTSSNLSEPLSPSPPIPDRKYLDSDVILGSSPPFPPDRRYSPSPERINPVPLTTTIAGSGARKTSTDSLQQPPMHQVSSMGNEYAIINPRHCQRKHGDMEVGVAEEGHLPAPILPMRAHQRMSSRENLLADTGTCTTEEMGMASAGTEVSEEHVPERKSGHYADLGMSSPPPTLVAPEGAKEGSSIAYSVVKLDSVSGKFEAAVPLCTSPQPYEVASPTSHHLSTLSQSPSGTEPHYEEIERPADDASGQTNTILLYTHHITSHGGGGYLGAWKPNRQL